MARCFTAGAEFNAGATADMDYDSTSGATISYDTTLFRSGVASWKFVCAASAPFLTRQYTAASHSSFIREYINVSSMTTAASVAITLIRDATNGNNASIRLTRVSASTYTLALFNEQAGTQVGSSSPTLNTATWYRLEFSYIFATGVMSAYIDGVQFATGTGTASLGSNTLRWGSIDSSTMTINYDDVAINDDQGTFQNTLPGAGNVVRLKPNATGDINTVATQTGGTVGAANAFSRLNELLPDDATTFNGSSTLNEEDLVKVDTTAVPTTATINVVEVWGRYRNSVADTTAAFKFELEKAAASTIQQSSAIVPNSITFKMNAGAVPKLPPIVAYQDPSAATWNPATWTPQIGYKLTTAPGTAGRRVDVTNVSLVVDYTPSAGGGITTQQKASFFSTF